MSYIKYAKFDSPFGSMAIACSERGICRVLFPEERPFNKTLQFLYPLQKISKNKSFFRRELYQLKQYFSKDAMRFQCHIDLSMSPFYNKVLTVVRDIPYGKTFSYKEIAQQVRNHKAYRAVGNANAQNPIPIIIPCHRVISSDTSLGGYGGFPERKYYLLKMEGAI